jgi:hypothetical protein
MPLSNGLGEELPLSAETNCTGLNTISGSLYAPEAHSSKQNPTAVAAKSRKYPGPQARISTVGMAATSARQGSCSRAYADKLWKMVH